MTATTSPTASTGSAHASALSHLTKTIFTPGHDFLIMMALVLIFLMLWMPATREILKGIIGTLLIPAFSAVFLTTFRWMTKTGRNIWDSHAILIRNLYSSHHDIHPTLEEKREK